MPPGLCPTQAVQFELSECWEHSSMALAPEKLSQNLLRDRWFKAKAEKEDAANLKCTLTQDAREKEDYAHHIRTPPEF